MEIDGRKLNVRRCNAHEFLRIHSLNGTRACHFSVVGKWATSGVQCLFSDINLSSLATTYVRSPAHSTEEVFSWWHKLKRWVQPFRPADANRGGCMQVVKVKIEFATNARVANTAQHTIRSRWLRVCTVCHVLTSLTHSNCLKIIIIKCDDNIEIHITHSQYYAGSHK